MCLILAVRARERERERFKTHPKNSILIEVAVQKLLQKQTEEQSHLMDTAVISLDTHQYKIFQARSQLLQGKK